MKYKILFSAIRSFTFRKYRILLSALLVCHLLGTHVMATEVKPGLSCDMADDRYYISFSMPDFQIVTDTLSGDWGDAFFSSIQLYGADKFDYLHEDGRPTLPFYSLDLILPFSSTTFDVTSVQILDSITIILPYDYTPAQERINLSTELSYDANYYSTHEEWYHMYYSLKESNYRLYKGLNFALFPCRYVAETRELTIILNAIYEITFDGSSLPEYIQAELSEYDRLAYNFYDNFVDYPYSIIPPINGDRYLIITASEWEGNEALMQFAEHKELLGYNVTVTSIGEIGYAPIDIRDYIKNLYTTEELKYVLLVGNVDGIPFYDGLAEDSSDPPSDIYYSCLSKDIDEQWSDFNPSIFIGRWPVTSDEELRHVVDKTIASDFHLFEQNPRKIGLFSGSGDGEDYVYKDAKYIYDNVIRNSSYFIGDLTEGRNKSVSLNHSYLKTYLENSSSESTWMFIYRGLAASDTIMSYNYGCHNMDSILTHHAGMHPFGFGFADELGNIYDLNNFSRTWLTSTQGGVTFFAPTTEAYNCADRYFSRKVFNQLSGGRIVMTIGEFVANAKAKYYNPDQVLWRRREAKKYTLYGDPSLYLLGLDIEERTPNRIKHKSSTSAITQDTNIIIQNDVVQLNPAISGNVNSIYVYSITGQLMLTSYSNSINLNGLSQGVYLVTVNTDNGQISQKIVK